MIGMMMEIQITTDVMMTTKMLLGMEIRDILKEFL